MESYKCKFCIKSFINKRALRSHMSSLHKQPSQLSDETKSNVSSSSSEDQVRKTNGLRENNPKFDSFTYGESDTESSKNIMKRSKRPRKLDSFTTKKKMKTSQLSNKNEFDPELPLSTDSDTTTEKDLAFCLIMLSRDKWKKKKNNNNKTQEGYNKSSKINRKGRFKFKCETCDKEFKSYQALGGHRASHKKNRVCNKTEQEHETEYDVVVVTEKRIYECSICFRVFESGQALGGHKRSHGIGNLSVNHQVCRSKKMIDLNLPAPNEEDEEVSMVF